MGYVFKRMDQPKIQKNKNTKTYTTYKKTHTLRVTLLWHQWAEHVCVLMGTHVWWMYNVMLMSVI